MDGKRIRREGIHETAKDNVTRVTLFTLNGFRLLVTIIFQHTCYEI